MTGGVRVQEPLGKGHQADAHFIGMVDGRSLVDSDNIAEATTRDTLNIMNIRNESAWASRQRLKRFITIITVSLVVLYLFWRIFLLD